MARTSQAKPTAFMFYAPQAKKVSVAGNFNNWDTKKLTAKKDAKGNWIAKTNLRPGRYEYKIIVDGNWTNDPNCRDYSSNPFGSQNCIIEVR